MADFEKVSLAQSFSLGQLVWTARVADAIEPIGVLRLLKRHARGDWGDVPRCAASHTLGALCSARGEDGVCDWHKNVLALDPKEPERIFSAYNVEGAPEKVYVITEWDRSATTVLMASDY